MEPVTDADEVIQIDSHLDDKYLPQSLTDRLREHGVWRRSACELDAHRKRRRLLHARRLSPSARTQGHRPGSENRIRSARADADREPAA